MGDQQTSMPPQPATPQDGAVEGQSKTSVLTAQDRLRRARPNPEPPAEGNPRKCAICSLPPEIKQKANAMLIGTPGDPNSTPPQRATWTLPADLSKWLLQCTPPFNASVDQIRYHLNKHLKIFRGTKKDLSFDPSTPQPPPPLPASRVISVHKLDQTPNVTLPAKTDDQKPVKIPKTHGKIPKKQPPPLEQTTLLDEDDAGDDEAVETVEVVDGPQREDDQLDRLALAQSQPNTDLAYFELALREGSKTYASIARAVRRRPDKKITQPEAMFLVGGMQALSSGLTNYRQVLAMSKGGRFGAPEILDQKRGLKSLLQKERTVLPHDMPPKDAEPVGVPIPIEEQLAPVVTSTLPFDADALPESPPVPTFSLSDLPSPAAPDSSLRPVASDGGSTAMVHVAKAVGDSVGSGGGENPLALGGQKVDGGPGATVTPIKKWDAVM